MKVANGTERVRKKARRGLNALAPVRNPLREAVTATARELEDSNHGFNLLFDPVIAVDSELLIQREPVLDLVGRVISAPVDAVKRIYPASRWPERFGVAIRQMAPWDGSNAHLTEPDAHIGSFTDQVEKLLGRVQFAAEFKIRPEGCYTCLWTDFVLISGSYIARLSLSVTD
ncbi:hypothetical protein [Nocardia tengchongensis]|uniref:hypothetical protein n=1 Tax=Nocardia tengchongensis TaxID=2055889 RepID=UPI0036C0903C